MQGHCGQPEARKGPKLDHGRISFPKELYKIFNSEISSLGVPWVEGTKPINETFRDRLGNAKKRSINQIAMHSDLSLEEKAMALMTERIDFIQKNKVMLYCL